MYLECSGQQSGRCENSFHKGSKLGTDGKCKFGRAWEQRAEPCVLCSVLVPEHLGMRMNPRVVIALDLEKFDSDLIGRVMRGQAGLAECSERTVWLRFRSSSWESIARSCDNRRGRFCEKCVADISGQLNAGRGDREGKVSVQGEYIPFCVSIASAMEIISSLGQRIVELTNKIVHGWEPQHAFPRYPLDKDQLPRTECIVHLNDRAGCFCGGWHNYADMPALERPGKSVAFGYGPMCAVAAQQAGFKLDRSLKEALESYKERRGTRRDVLPFNGQADEDGQKKLATS